MSGTGERCAVCGGGLVQKLITHEIREGEELFVFDNVPAWVCAQCDGVWLEGDVKRKLEEIVAAEKQQ
ncbi:MAG: type II toxin-antitoxin system MqsA family antitoxin [Bryobacteraceae bacterium]|nr:type II toxin-antitoxin system MqsA family antitoxin [Bryobacteraceae bacterium]